MHIDPKQFMWEQKYRPATLSDCILPEADIKRFAGIIKEGRVPHLLLCSKSPGTGKTTMARVLCNDMNAEMMFVSGGNVRIDTLRTELTQFASTMPNSEKTGGKVIIIDEADNPGMKAVHAELRSWMEAYSHNCSVIMTCNNVEVIPAALQSRCRVIEFGNPTDEDKTRMMKEMIRRCIFICGDSGVAIDDETGRRSIAALVKKNFPDIRKTITELDSYAKMGVVDEGVLTHATRATSNFNELIDALREKKMGLVREMVPRFTADYTSFITTLYKELMPLISPRSIRMMLTLLSENQKYAANIPNLEIHIFALLADLCAEMEWK